MEYATRAGASTARYYGETDELLGKYAWYQKNSDVRTWPVGTLKPNDFGLFDTLGNVFTWCQDKYRPYPKPIGTTDDLANQEEDVSSDFRVMRGGSFISGPLGARSAARNYGVPSDRDNSVGFRPARTITDQPR
jgi:formylglycine-generating enzyme required for sulfatase activity